MLEVSGSRRNPRAQIFPLEYIEIHARYSSSFLETFICRIIPEDKNQQAVLPAGSPGWPGSRTQIFIITQNSSEKPSKNFYGNDFSP
jgi:hypothetical protein